MLKFYRVNPAATIPQYQTKQSACFDLHACLEGERVKGFDRNNKDFLTNQSNKIAINPGERVLIPTGMIIDIPVGFSVRLHARSGLSLKQGLVLANAEGVIDSDYVDPTFVMITNVSTVVATINHGDRIAQGELIPALQAVLGETTLRPTQKTDRQGGLGSTGV